MSTSPSHTTPPDPVPENTTGEVDRLFKLSQDLLCVSRLDGYFKQVNPSWTRVLGWTENELLTRPVVEFVHPEDRERTLTARVKLNQSGQLSGFENRYLCKNGSYRWLAWEVTMEPGAKTIFGVARDVTEHRRVEHEHLILSKLESTGILAGGIAHDFNNLLTGLMLNMDLISLLGALNEDQTKHLQGAQENARAAQALAKKLIILSKGGSSLRRTVCIMVLLLQSLEVALIGSSVRGMPKIADSLWPVEIDENQISQTVYNLVLNAREAKPINNTVQLSAQNVVLSASNKLGLPAGNYVQIAVSDQGTGIAAETMPTIFDPYFSTKQRGSQKGMGLGLTICFSIIKKHRGAITVDSEPGKGTIAVIHLPSSPATKLESSTFHPFAPV